MYDKILNQNKETNIITTSLRDFEITEVNSTEVDKPIRDILEASMGPSRWKI